MITLDRRHVDLILTRTIARGKTDVAPKQTKRKKSKKRHARDNPTAVTAMYRKNLVLYLADPDHDFVKKKQYPSILGVSKETLYYHFSPDDLSDIENEAFTIRKKALIPELVRVYRAMQRSAVGYTLPVDNVSTYKGTVTVTPYDEHFPPNPKAAELFLNRIEGPLAQLIELAGKGGGPIAGSFTMDVLKEMDVEDLRELRKLLTRIHAKKSEAPGTPGTPVTGDTDAG